MLKKLLKYDLEYVFKVLVVFYILAIFFAILTRIFLNIDDSFILNIIGKICNGTEIAMFFNILINSIMRLWVRFKNNFYGDESYLTHTLPVDKKTLYLSKTLSSIITLFVSMIIIAFSIFISYYSKENIEILKNLLLPFTDIYNTSMVSIILIFLFIFMLEVLSLLQSGYTGMILGHRMNNAKMGYSILFGFITYMIIQILALLILFIFAIFNKDIMNLFFTNQMVNIDILKSIIYMSSIFYTIIIIVIYIINLKLFKKGVNVE